MFLNTLFLQCEFVNLTSNPEVVGHPGRLSTTAYSIFVFEANFYIWKPTLPSATRVDAPLRCDINPRMDIFF